jgi:hypothetical protein
LGNISLFCGKRAPTAEALPHLGQKTAVAVSSYSSLVLHMGQSPATSKTEFCIFLSPIIVRIKLKILYNIKLPLSRKTFYKEKAHFSSEKAKFHNFFLFRYCNGGKSVIKYKIIILRGVGLCIE